MCGIAGIIGSQDGGWKQRAIQLMTDAMAHRGPNAEGHFVDMLVALGHRRLSIVDLSSHANQPFFSNDGRYVLVFNGEIYNFRQLRLELRGCSFRTQSDTEVLLAAYGQWGEECVQHLVGMFAFAIWDKVTNRLFVARDRLGVKPFYYAETGDAFVFASELRAVLASGVVRREVDPAGVCDYLAYQAVQAPRTMVAGVKQLMPGECGYWQNGKFTKRTYWSLPTAGDGKFAPEAYGDYPTICENVRRLLYEAVERRLVSDVPLGAFLSGGIDSTAIVAIMAQLAGQQVDTFSVVFKEALFDESRFSHLAAQRFGTRHHPLLLESHDFLSAVPEALRAMDSPSGDGINTYVVSQVTKKEGVTVALSGVGGDELFAGYSIFRVYEWLRSRRMWWSLPRAMRVGLAGCISKWLATHQRTRFMELAGARSCAVADIYPSLRKVIPFADFDGGSFLPKGQVQDSVRETLMAQRERAAGLPPLSQLSVADMCTYMQNVLLQDTDQMSMAHALEVRVPFVDHFLVEYVLRVPDRWKDLRSPKKLLVDALKPLIPTEIAARPKKGFELPWRKWLKEDLREFCEVKLRQFDERQYVRPGLPVALWREFLSGQNDRLWSRCWVFVVLESWLEHNLS